MRRLTMLAGAVCVALTMSSGAFAQVPPDPSNPNEAVPDAMSPPPYGEPINLETAKKVAAAAAAEFDASATGRACASRWSARPAISSISRSTTTASSPRSRSRSTRRAPPRRYRRPTVVFERSARQGRLLLLSADARRRHRIARRQSADGRRQDHRRDRLQRRHRLTGRRDLAGRRRGAEVNGRTVSNSAICRGQNPGRVLFSRPSGWRAT